MHRFGSIHLSRASREIQTFLVIETPGDSHVGHGRMMDSSARYEGSVRHNKQDVDVEQEVDRWESRRMDYSLRLE